MSDRVISFDSVTLKRAGRVILENISFSLDRGMFLGIIGPNGVGKSTLVASITGFLSPSKGDIVVGQKPLRCLRAKERAKNIALVAQEHNIDITCKVSALLEMGRYCHNAGLFDLGLNDREVIERYASYCQVSEFLDRNFDTLSGGEKQRVLFARALIQEAQILVLDEPSSNLDMAHEHALFAMAKEYAQERKLVIAAIHNINIAIEYCTHLMVLHENGIVAFGKTHDVISRELVERVFGLPVQLVNNEHSGSSMIVHAPLYSAHKEKTVHLIGGAGSAINITRILVQSGYRVSGGIAHGLDSDSQLWQSLGIEQVKVDPFAPIDDESFKKAKVLVDAADMTILCDFPFGQGNMRNLELARESKNLIVLEGGGGGCTREFWLEGLSEQFDLLCHQPTARHMSYEACVELIKKV